MAAMCMEASSWPLGMAELRWRRYGSSPDSQLTWYC